MTSSSEFMIRKTFVLCFHHLNLRFNLDVCKFLTSDTSLNTYDRGERLISSTKGPNAYPMFKCDSIDDSVHGELQSISKQFNYLEREVQFLFILVMCSIYDEIPDDKVKTWLNLLLTQPNATLFINTTISDVMFESSIVPDTLKQSLTTRILNEKKWTKLRALVEWIDTDKMVKWITSNDKLIEIIWHKELDQDTILFVISQLSDHVKKEKNVNKYYPLLTRLMGKLVEKPFMDVELEIVDKIAKSNLDNIHLEYILALLKFDDTIRLKYHLATCEQLGVKINSLLGQSKSTVILAVTLISFIYNQEKFSWSVFLPTEALLTCAMNNPQLHEFFRSIETGHSHIKTDHLYNCHLNLLC